MRKRTILCFLLFILLLSSSLSFTSCRTTTETKVEYVTEYVPLAVDLTDIVEPVFAMRPDNSELTINTDQIVSALDIAMNAVQYQKAWFMWQTYAETLEGVINEIRDVYGPKN